MASNNTIAAAGYKPQSTAEADAYRFLFGVAAGKGSSIGGKDAVSFFMKSGLTTPVLKQIWSTASCGKPEMTAKEFCTAMRLISLAQSGLAIDGDVLKRTLGQTFELPKFNGIEIPKPAAPAPAAPAAAPAVPTSPHAAASYTITPEHARNYLRSWSELPKSEAGLLEGKDAAPFFAKSGQSRENLRAIWKLADVTSDGMMDKVEFFVAMQLTMLAKKGGEIPAELPAELLRSARAVATTGEASIASQAAAANTSALSNSSLLASSSSPPPPLAVPPALTKQASSYSEAGHDSLLARDALMEARTELQSQVSRTQLEISSLTAEKASLAQSLQEESKALMADLERLRAADKEVARLREECASLRRALDARRVAVTDQREKLNQSYTELAETSRELASLAVGGEPAQQPRRPAPVPHTPTETPAGASGAFDDFGSAPSAGAGAFDDFSDPFGAGGSSKASGF